MRPFKIVLWTLFIFWLISISGRFNNNINSLLSPMAKEGLRSVIESSLKGSSGRYGIFIKDLKAGESYYLNENQQFEAGSLYKLWIMGASFEKIKRGELKEDEILSDKVENLNALFNIASDEAELKEGEIEMSVSSAISQMITISHNYAALLLTKDVGISKVSEFLKRYDLNQSSVGNEVKTTPVDVGKFFEKLYKGEVIDEEISGKMLGILAEQKTNDRLPKLLPEGTKVAHKTADIGFFEHDAGIVFTPSRDYIIVVLSETESPQAAGDRIAKLSKAVYEYFNGKIN